MLIHLGFFLLFLSTGLTLCYSFRLFYFVMCCDFNFVSSHSMVEPFRGGTAAVFLDLKYSMEVSNTSRPL